jgi:hypothetical protein
MLLKILTRRTLLYCFYAKGYQNTVILLYLTFIFGSKPKKIQNNPYICYR